MTALLLTAGLVVICVATAAAYIAGYRTGIHEGRDEGREVGVGEGLRIGEAKGYIAGYDRGLADASPAVEKDFGAAARKSAHEFHKRGVEQANRTLRAFGVKELDTPGETDGRA